MTKIAKHITFGACLCIALILSGCGKHHDNTNDNSNNGGTDEENNGGNDDGENNGGTGSYKVNGKVTGIVVGDKAAVSLNSEEKSIASAEISSDGSYVLENIPDGSYKLVPSSQGYTFEPASIDDIVVKGKDVTVNDIVATKITAKYTVSGKITITVDNAGLDKVTVLLNSAQNSEPISATTNSEGVFEIKEVLVGEYTVTPVLDGYAFNPSNKSVKVENADVMDVNFAVTICKDMWCPQPLPQPDISKADLKAIWGASDKNIWVVGTAGTVLNYDGTWKPVKDGVDGNAVLNSVWGTEDGKKVWTVGENGVAYNWTEASKKWTVVNTNTKENLNGIWGNDSYVWIVGGKGTILKCTVAGDKCDSEQWPTTANLNGIWGANSSDIWAVGEKYQEKATFLHFVNDSWRNESTEADIPSVNYKAITKSPSYQPIIAVGEDTVVQQGPIVAEERFFFENYKAISFTSTTGNINPTKGNDILVTGYSGEAGAIWRIGSTAVNKTWVIDGTPKVEKLAVEVPPLRSIWSTNNGATAWAVGDKGTIIKQFK